MFVYYIWKEVFEYSGEKGSDIFILRFGLANSINI